MELEGEALQMAMAILATVRQMDGRYGRTKILKILKGSKAQGIPDWPEGFGVLKSAPMATLESLVQGMLDGGYLATLGSEYPMLGLGPQGQEAVEGIIPLEVHMAEMPAVAMGKRGPKAGAVSRKSSPEDSAAWRANPALALHLKEWRNRTAAERGVPAYCILSNRSLESIASVLPTSPEDLQEVHGIGPAKQEEFGAEILELVRKRLE
ncbi:MAG: HRDC domain-containing protein [Planctomycetota bacterium]|jgi:superfamily II DNA helicase RecQ